MAQKNSMSDENVFLDSDQDGLSDTEELVYKTDPENKDTDGDGYSDGTEVKSGYDPLKPAPGDKINDDSTANVSKDLDINTKTSSGENLTEEFSSKIATIIANEEADAQGITVSDINSLIEENLPKNMQAEELPEIDKSEIKIKEQDYSDLSEEERAKKIKEDEDEYLSLMLYISSNNLPHNLSMDNEATSFFKEITSKIGTLYSNPEEMTYFNELAEKGEVILEQMQEIEVPESIIDLHIEGLQIANYAISLKDKVSINRNDPISSIVSLSSVESLLIMGSDFITKVEKMTEDGNTSLEGVNISDKSSKDTEDGDNDDKNEEDEETENDTDKKN